MKNTEIAKMLLEEFGLEIPKQQQNQRTGKTSDMTIARDEFTRIKKKILRHPNMPEDVRPKEKEQQTSLRQLVFMFSTNEWLNFVLSHLPDNMNAKTNSEQINKVHAHIINVSYRILLLNAMHGSNDRNYTPFIYYGNAPLVIWGPEQEYYDTLLEKVTEEVEVEDSKSSDEDKKLEIKRRIFEESEEYEQFLSDVTHDFNNPETSKDAAFFFKGTDSFDSKYDRPQEQMKKLGRTFSPKDTNRT